MCKMRKWLAALLVVLMLPGMAMAEAWKFAPDHSPDLFYEEIRWFSISPNGTYLLGVGGEEADDAAAFLLYNTRTMERKTIEMPIVDENSNTHRVLQRLLYSYEAISDIVVHWSADERCFTFSGYDAFAKGNANCVHALYIGDAETGTLSIAAEWGTYMIRSNYGAVINACFAPDSSALYFTLYNDDVFEACCVVAKYDLQTGEITPHIPLTGKTGEMLGRSLVAVSDDVFLMTDNPDGQLVIARRQGSFWTYEYLLGKHDSSRAAVKNVEYSAVSGMGILYCNVDSPNQSTRGVMIFRMDPQGNVTSLRILRTYETPMNVRLSPDGRYALLLMRNFDSRYSSMEMLDLETLECTYVETPALDDHDLEMMEFSSGFSSWKNGFFWGGKYLLSGVYDHQLLKLSGGPETPKTDMISQPEFCILSR